MNLWSEIGTIRRLGKFGRRWSSGLSHVDSKRKIPRMVDVGGKQVTRRMAVAESKVFLPDEVWVVFKGRNDMGELISEKKGPISSTAIIAGVLAAKKTSELIPFCHQIKLDKVDITIEEAEPDLLIRCKVACEGKTGAEMEALVGASTAALCVYDMCKSISHKITFQTKLLQKTGGKGGTI